jgi:hypothetical protein
MYKGFIKSVFFNTPLQNLGGVIFGKIDIFGVQAVIVNRAVV